MMDIYLKLFQIICLMKDQAFLVYNDFLSHVTSTIGDQQLSYMRSGNYNRILLFSEGDDFFRREINKKKWILKIVFAF